MTKRKPIKTEKELICWAELSKHLTGKTDNIRKNRVPKKHNEEIDLLLYYISKWIEGKKLICEDDLKEKLSKIDLFTVIADKI